MRWSAYHCSAGRRRPFHALRAKVLQQLKRRRHHHHYPPLRSPSRTRGQPRVRTQRSTGRLWRRRQHGYEHGAGGHIRGQDPLLPLPETATGQLDLPVLAAGGIGSAPHSPTS